MYIHRNVYEVVVYLYTGELYVQNPQSIDNSRTILIMIRKEPLKRVLAADQAA